MRKKILIFGSFIAASMLVAVTFVTSTTYTQLAIATLLYPPLVYFAFKCFPHKSYKTDIDKPVVAIQPVTKSKKENVETVDIDKRAFLKLIGAAGFSFFIFSIFAKRAESLLFGKAVESGVVALEDTAGNKINPTERQPTDGYIISEVDNGEFTFYGFINKNGGWYIMKENPDTGSFRYTKGESNFPGGWNNRKLLNYDYFHNVFS